MITKKRAVIMLAALFFQPTQAMYDICDLNILATVAKDSVMVGKDYFYRTFTFPPTVSSNDTITLHKQCTLMNVRELQATINTACLNDDSATLQEALGCLAAKFNVLKLTDKYFDSQEYILNISREVRTDEKVYPLVQCFKQYYECGRFLTQAFTPNVEEQLQKTSLIITHAVLRNNFLKHVTSLTDKEAIQKVINEYFQSDSYRRALLLECAQMFGHKNELLKRICSQITQNNCHDFVNKAKATDILFFYVSNQ